ncbi:MAG: hypothetical protein SVU32_03740, partial [Candidatus Nanohaloarchaea archaeon]|nr:hypothetical protein [Candidatus Nanohaloarchaea archaeon]
MSGLVTMFAVLLALFVAFVTVPFFVAVERPAQGGEAQVVPEPAVLEGVAATADLVDGDAGTATAAADGGLVGRV